MLKSCCILFHYIIFVTATGKIERSDAGILSEAKDSEWDITNAGIIYEE